MNAHYRDWIAWSLAAAIIVVVAVEVTAAVSAIPSTHTVEDRQPIAVVEPA